MSCSQLRTTSVLDRFLPNFSFEKEKENTNLVNSMTGTKLGLTTPDIIHRGSREERIKISSRRKVGLITRLWEIEERKADTRETPTV